MRFVSGGLCGNEEWIFSGLITVIVFELTKNLGNYKI